MPEPMTIPGDREPGGSEPTPIFTALVNANDPGCIMPIETMPAGRALDALVTEKVMNWHVPSSTDIAWLMSVGTNTDGAAMLSLVPPYSTDIAAAWLVVAKMQIAVIPGENGLWYAAADDPFREPHWYERNVNSWDRAETAPLAICRAALAAVAAQTAPSR